jgi:hypothetical protein
LDATHEEVSMDNTAPIDRRRGTAALAATIVAAALPMGGLLDGVASTEDALASGGGAGTVSVQDFDFTMTAN